MFAKFGKSAVEKGPRAYKGQRSEGHARKHVWPVLLALLVALLQTVLYLSGPGQNIEFIFSDLWFKLRGPAAPPGDVAIVAMDETSYSALGIPMNQPWPRKVHAELLERLAQYGVRRVAFDIVFAGEGADPAADEALAAALKKVPAVIASDVGYLDQRIGNQLYRIENMVEPAAMFKAASRQVALAKMPEEQGVIRRFVLPKSASTSGMPFLYEAAANLVPGSALFPGKYDLIDYYGPPGTIPTYSYYTLLEPGAQPKDILRNKVVFVGLNLRTDVGAAQKDSYNTVFHEYRGKRVGQTFGVEIQATAAQNLLSQKWITRVAPGTEAAVLFFVCTVLTLVIFSIRPHWGLCTLLSAAICWAGLAYLSLVLGYFVPGATTIIVALPIAFSLSTLRYYLLTYRAQQQVEQAFRLYLSPEMAKAMRDSRALELGGEEVEATALFTDIAGFTRMAEGMEAQDLAAMLNDYFTVVVNAIFDRKGTVIKFIGDAVFALWGAPVALLNHAEMACRGALAIQQAVAEFNRRGRYPFLYTRIGINTGPMLVGNLGAKRRFDYTAVGDSVNLASRLEGLNKHLGTSVLLSGTVASRLNGAIDPLKLGVMRVSGKSKGVELYTAFSRRLAPGAKNEWLKALTAYSRRDFKEAHDTFIQVSSLELQLAGIAKVYLSEMERLEREGLDSDWSGELVFFEK